MGETAEIRELDYATLVGRHSAQRRAKPIVVLAFLLPRVGSLFRRHPIEELPTAHGAGVVRPVAAQEIDRAASDLSKRPGPYAAVGVVVAVAAAPKGKKGLLYGHLGQRPALGYEVGERECRV